MKVFCFHHRDADGFCAAIAVHEWAQRNGHSVIYKSIQYGEPVEVGSPEIDRVMFVDFCPTQAELEQLCKEFQEVDVIDHHKTQLSILMACADKYDNMIYNYSDEVAGCVLAWNVLLKEHAPLMLQYVGDRDMWKWELVNSAEVNEAIGMLDDNLENWIVAVKAFNFVAMKTQGELLIAYRERQITRALRHMQRIGRVGVVNTGAFTSETGNRMLAEHTDIAIAAMFFMNDEGKWIVSLRSRKEENVDVGAIAKSFGGGGHRNAAGFGVYGHETMMQYLNHIDRFGISLASMEVTNGTSD